MTAPNRHPAVTAAVEALRAPHVTVYADGEIGDTPERIAAAVVPAVLEWAAEYITHHHINLTGYAISEHMDAWAREIAGSDIAAPSDAGRRCDALCRDVEADRDRLLAERDEARRLASFRADVIARYRKEIEDAGKVVLTARALSNILAEPADPTEVIADALGRLTEALAEFDAAPKPTVPPATIAADASDGDAGTSGHPQPGYGDLEPITDENVAATPDTAAECRDAWEALDGVVIGLLSTLDCEPSPPPSPLRTETPMPDPCTEGSCAALVPDEPGNRCGGPDGGAQGCGQLFCAPHLYVTYRYGPLCNDDYDNIDDPATDGETDA